MRVSHARTTTNWHESVPLLDGVADDKTLDEDLLLLAQAVHAVVRLRLGRVVPRQVQAVAASISVSESLQSMGMTSEDDALDDPVGRHEVEAHAATFDAVKLSV